MPRLLKSVRSTINTSHSILSNATNKYLSSVNSSTSNVVINNAINGSGKKFTMSFWIRRTRVGVAERLLSNLVSGSENQVDISFNTSNQLSIGWGGGTGVSEGYVSGTSLFMIGHWYNIVISFDQTRSATNRTRLVINGVLDTPSATSSNLTSILNSNRDYNFGLCGSIGISSTGFFYKKMFMFWNVELGVNEVQTLYNNGNPLNSTLNSGDYISASNLKLLFDMENAVWTTVFTISDTSGNSNGTLVSIGHVQADYVQISPS